MIKRCTMRV